MKEEKYKFGIIYIREKDEFQMVDVDAAFDYIPDESNTSIIYQNGKEPVEVGVKAVGFDIKNQVLLQ